MLLFDYRIKLTLWFQFRCCGYWNGTTAGQFTTAQGFCLETAFAASQPGCQPSSGSSRLAVCIADAATVTSSSSPGSDFILETLFSTVYGFEAIIVCFFFATLCVINEASKALGLCLSKTSMWDAETCHRDASRSVSRESTRREEEEDSCSRH